MLFRHLMQRNRQIGEYTIIKPVGEGRFGICYLATDANSRLVILKRLKPKNFFKDRGKRAHEAIILSHINHPAIPQFLGVVEKNSFYAYVLEQKPGYSVEMMLYKMQHHFSVNEIYLIGIKLLEIIKYLHQSGVVHRDIRVPNVLINEDEVYLVDFGLARLIDQDRYRPELDFVFFGDFIIHLLYSNYARTMKLRKQPWHKELALTDLQCLFLKRLLGLDDKYGNIDEIEEDFKVFFDPLVCL